jgi:hypothetical protein
MAEREQAPTRDAEQRARQAEAALADALAERNRLWAELQRRTSAARELDHYKNAYNHLVQSNSWRLTAPLRSGRWFVRHVPEMVRRFRRFLAGRPRGR